MRGPWSPPLPKYQYFNWSYIFLSMASWPLAKKDKDVSSASKTSANGTWRCLTLTSTDGNSWPVTGASGGWRLAAPSRGMRPNDHKLQVKERCSGRIARQQCVPYQTPPTGAASATETATTEWDCTVTTGAAPPTDTSTRGTYSWSLEINRGQQAATAFLSSSLKYSFLSHSFQTHLCCSRTDIQSFTKNGSFNVC